MSCRMPLEMKPLFNWSTSVGDRPPRKSAGFWKDISRRSWMLHFLKKLTIICCYNLKFKLNCQHFPLPFLCSVAKALWFVIITSASSFFFLYLFSEHEFLFFCLRQNPASLCLSFWISWWFCHCHWQLGISPCISVAGRMVPRISFCCSHNPTFTWKTPSFSLFLPSQHKHTDQSMSLCNTFMSRSVYFKHGGLACLGACREGSYPRSWSRHQVF